MKQRRHQPQPRTDKPHPDASQHPWQLTEDPMAKHDRQVPVVDAVVAGDSLYPRGDCMVTDPPGKERGDEESDVREALGHGTSLESFCGSIPMSSTTPQEESFQTVPPSVDAGCLDSFLWTGQAPRGFNQPSHCQKRRFWNTRSDPAHRRSLAEGSVRTIRKVRSGTAIA